MEVNWASIVPSKPIEIKSVFKASRSDTTMLFSLKEIGLSFIMDPSKHMSSQIRPNEGRINLSQYENDVEK